MDIYKIRSVKKKYRIIHTHELKIARLISQHIVKTPELTVWEILIPIIFILKFAQINQARDTLVQNLLFTKRLALNAAKDMMLGCSRKEVLKQIMDHTASLIVPSNSGLYSKIIRKKQLKEICILIDHYGLLLNADGTDYYAIVKKAYGTHGRFVSFIERLNQAEAETSQAAKETLGNSVNTERAALIESLFKQKRMGAAANIFQSERAYIND